MDEDGLTMPLTVEYKKTVEEVLWPRQASPVEVLGSRFSRLDVRTDFFERSGWFCQRLEG